MNVQKLRESLEVLRNNLGGGLLAADIYGANDGQTIVALDNKPHPVADAVFCRIIKMMSESLRDAKFPPLGKYVLMDLEDNKVGIVLPLGDYQWGMLLDNTKTQLGLALNVAIPKAIQTFKEALAED